MLGEVNAAIDSALLGGATEIVCNDPHGTMNNLDPTEPHARADYIAGRHKLPRADLRREFGAVAHVQPLRRVQDRAQQGWSPFFKDTERVVVKQSITRFAASAPHPLDAREAIASAAMERTGTRAVRVEDTDPLAVFRSFVGITYITRVAEGR